MHRTRQWNEHPEAFLGQLTLEIVDLVREAELKQMYAAVRLNVFSDIDWFH